MDATTTMFGKVVDLEGGHDLFPLKALRAEPGGKTLVLNRPGFDRATEITLDRVDVVYVLNAAGDTVAHYQSAKRRRPNTMERRREEEIERARKDVEKLLVDEDQHPHRRRPVE